MTDVQVVRAAERLVYNNSLKQSLPPHYTLLELAQANEGINLVAIAFLKKHGARLSSLSPVLYRELKGWSY